MGGEEACARDWKIWVREGKDGGCKNVNSNCISLDTVSDQSHRDSFRLDSKRYTYVRTHAQTPFHFISKVNSMWTFLPHFNRHSFTLISMQSIQSKMTFPLYLLLVLFQKVSKKEQIQSMNCRCKLIFISIDLRHHHERDKNMYFTFH